MFQLYRDELANGGDEIEYDSAPDMRVYQQTSEYDWPINSKMDVETVPQWVEYGEDNDRDDNDDDEVVNKLVGARAKRFGFGYFPFNIGQRRIFLRSGKWNKPQWNRQNGRL